MKCEKCDEEMDEYIMVRCPNCGREHLIIDREG